MAVGAHQLTRRVRYAHCHGGDVARPVTQRAAEGKLFIRVDEFRVLQMAHVDIAQRSGSFRREASW